jgi:hypothetical protein
VALERKTIVVAYRGGEVARYPLIPPVQMEFERVEKTSLNRELSATQLYQLAWYAHKAASTGEVIQLVDKWIADVEAVDVETEAITPFGAGRSDGESPPSP